VSQMKSRFTEPMPSLTSKDAMESHPTSNPPSNADADEFSTMVWRFVVAADGLVHNFDSEVCWALDAPEITR
jgi:hypothetical protein